MGEEASSSWPVVDVDHQELPESAATRLLEVLVDHDLHRPDMFELRFQEDPEGDVLGEARIHIGSTVAISAHGLGQTAVVKLIEGEVVAIEAEYADLVGRTIVRGYDPSHRLHRGQRATTYRNAKISDVARTIARRAGLAVGTIDDSGAVLEVVSQFGVSDWEFLSGHARELDFELSVIDGRFHFRRPAKASSAPPEGSEQSSNPRQLVFGDDLLEFRPRLSAGQQVEQVQVRAWDPARKRVMIGSARAGADHAQLSTAPAGLTGTVKGSAVLAHDRPLGTQSELDATARSIAEQIGSTLVEAEGVALGTPALRAGVTVSVAQVARRFAGRYTLTRTLHVFDADGYRTRFVVSGRQQRSLLGLASNGSAGRGGPISGAIVAQVTDNDDPGKLGRVKLSFPTLSDSYVSDWARVVQLGAGPKSGASFLPEVHDEVLCAFEFGDIRRPYVLGGLHNGRDTPLLGDGIVDAGRVTRRGFVSRKGHRVILFDGDSASGIALLTADGKLRVSLNQTKGQIHIHSQGPVLIDTDSGAISIKGGGNVALEATGSLSLKGNAGVKIESSAVVEVKGGVVKLN